MSPVGLSDASTDKYSKISGYKHGNAAIMQTNRFDMRDTQRLTVMFDKLVL